MNLKLLLIIVGALIAFFVVVVTIYFFILGFKSKGMGSMIGMVDNRLAKCSKKPNCVCSEFEEAGEKFINPLQLSSKNQLEKIKSEITDMGGNIVTDEENYLHATFSTAFFRFVDDLEVRVDDPNQLIHFRSASRVGYSDMGVNRKRVEKLLSRLQD